MFKRSALVGALSLCVCLSAALAQAPLPLTWVNFYGQPSGSAAEGGTGAVSMSKSFDGGWLWLSNDLNPQPTQPNHNNCCAVVVTKVDSTRAVEYQSSFTSIFGGGGLYPHAILEDSSHNAVFATNIVNNPWIVKIDSTGNVLFNKVSYEAGASGFFTEGLALAEAAGGGYAVAGAWVGPNANDTNLPWAALVGIDASDGHGLWAKYYPTDSSEAPSHAVAVVRTSDGYAIAADYNDGTDGMYRLIRTDANGAPSFDKAYHVAGQTWVPTSVLQLADGTFILAGNSFGAGALGNLVIHLHSDGTIDWQKIYFTTFNFLGAVAESSLDHNIVFAGADNNSASIYKVSAADGSLIWAKQFQSPGFNFMMRFTGVVAESDGSVTVAGNGANYPNEVIGDTLLHVGPNGEFTGCLLGELTSTAAVTVSDGAAVAETLNSATVSILTVANTPPAGFDISAEDISTQYSACETGFLSGFLASTLSTDVHATGNSNGNGVFEPGETINVEPGWFNASGSGLDVTGFTPQFQDDDGLGFPAHATADYGTVGAGTFADCFNATGECYQFGLSLAVPRPSLHWDIAFDETLNDHSSVRWAMHIGASFADIPTTDNFYKYIETALHNGITAGCGGGNYCSTSNTTRAQMAVFLLKGEHGGGYVPPPCSATVFTDVPCPGGPNVDWVNQLAAEGITGGCGGGNYCPGNPVSRGAMAVFLLKGEHGGAYVAPACSATIFNDEPCPGGPFVDWVNTLVSEGITAGCGNGNYCPNNTVTRGQMAVFLSRTFGLALNTLF